MTVPAVVAAGGPSHTKLTVNITPKTVAALKETATTNEESKTDAVNRAIQIYAFLTRMLAEGWELVLRNPAEGREERVYFL